MALGRNDEQPLPDNKLPPIDIEWDEDDLEIVLQLPTPEEWEAQAAALEKAAPHLNIGQRFAGGTVNFLKSMGCMVWGAGIALDENAPLLPVPSDYALPAIGVMGAQDAIKALRALSQREHPLDYLFLQGSGSFAKGLAMEAGKKVAAAVPPILLAAGISYGRDALFNYAMEDPENNELLMMGLSYANMPLLRSLVVTVPSLLLYWGGQKAIERWVPGMKPPVMPVEEHPDTEWYQKLLAEALDAVNAMTLAGLGRQVFITIGPEAVMHSPLALMMGPGFFLLLALLQYYAENPHPFKNVRDLVSEFADMFAKTEVEGAVPQQEEQADAAHQNEQSAARIAANISIKIGIALSALVLTALINRYVSAAISSAHPDAGGDNDPSSWTTAERESYVFGLIVLMDGLMKAFENIPAVVNKVKQDGPGVVEKIREGAPVLAHNVSESVSVAAKKTGQSVTAAAQKTKEFLGTSVAGLFGRKPAHAALQVVDPNPFFLDNSSSDDDDVTDGFTI